MFVKMRSDWHSHSLLGSETTTLDKGLAGSYNTQYESTQDAAILLLGIYSRDKKTYVQT